MPTRRRGIEADQREAKPQSVPRVTATTESASSAPRASRLTSAQGGLALQASIGNAAFVQMMREADLLRSRPQGPQGAQPEETALAVQRSAVHELTHVIQQRQISAPSDRFELAAEGNAARSGPTPAPDSNAHLPRAAGDSADAGSARSATETIQRAIRIVPSAESEAREMKFEEAVRLLLDRPNGAAISLAVVSRMIESNKSFQNVDEFAAEAAKEPGTGEEGSLTLGQLSDLTRRHTEQVSAATADFGSERSAMLRGIPSGSSFSSKYKDGELGGNLDANDLRLLKSRVQDFHQFANDMQNDLPADIKSGNMRLYRSADVDPAQLEVGGTVRQALPFSATYSYDFTAQEWGDKPVVLAIDAPVSHQMVSLSHIGAPMEKKPLNQEQLEVAVGPCTLVITEVRPIGDRTLASAVVHPLSQEAVADDIDEAIERSAQRLKRKREDFTLDDEKLPGMFETSVVEQIRAFTSEGSTLQVVTMQGRSLELCFGDARFGWTFQE
ncbi:hypothetical protein ACF07L_37985 [Streptomyces anulatus]|uniref:hypothetical protein n=1 Tax=Streptomyces anulatus TaxID=1892 RepID=UPI0036FA6980